MAVENRGPQVQATAVLFLILSWISVSLRCYVRIFMTRTFQLDDWLAVLTLVLFTVFCIVVLLGVATGTGQHTENISVKDRVDSFMWWYFGELFYALSTWLSKICIAIFLMQICFHRYHFIIVWSIIVIFSAYTAFYFFMAAFQCRPVYFFWTRLDGDMNGTCVSETIFLVATYIQSVLSVVADWTLAILPAFLVRNLDMNPRTKISVAVILGIGALGSTATIVRIPYIQRLSTLEDFLFQNSDVSIWSTVEVGLCLTASSMACLKPLFRVFLSKSKILTSPSWSIRDVSRPSRGGNFSNMDLSRTKLTSIHSSVGKNFTGTTIVGSQCSFDANLEGAVEITPTQIHNAV